MHKFKVDNSKKNGFIISYNPNTQLHEIAYEGEEEHCFFNLQEDLARGDLIIKGDWFLCEDNELTNTNVPHTN